MTLWKQLHCIDDHALAVTALVGDANPVVVAGIEAEEKVRHSTLRQPRESIIGAHNLILNDGKSTYICDAEGNRTSKTDNVSSSTEPQEQVPSLPSH